MFCRHVSYTVSMSCGIGSRACDSSAAGHSLLEVVICTSLIGFVGILLLQLYPTSFVAVQQARHKMEAEMFASSLLEQERGANFDSLVVNSIRYPDPKPGQDGTIFRAILSVSRVEGLDSDHVVAVEAEVSWEDKTGKRKVKMVTYVANQP